MMRDLEDIIGNEVVSADARILGVVDGVAIDTNSWLAPAIKICLKRGVEITPDIKKPQFGAACFFIESANVESVSDLITLSKKFEDLKNILVDPSQVPLTAGDIVGKRVIGRKGREIGIVESITFDIQATWTVRSFKIRLERRVIDDLKLKKRLLTTPLISIATRDILTVGDLVMLSIDTDQLRQILEKV